jgi:hypothetical protein
MSIDSILLHHLSSSIERRATQMVYSYNKMLVYNNKKHLKCGGVAI